MLAIFEGDTWAHHLLKEGLEESRHRAVPQWEDDDEVLRRKDSVSRLDGVSGR
jgi:hypothetical protein